MENEKKRKLEIERENKTRTKRKFDKEIPFNFISKCSSKSCNLRKHDNVFFEKSEKNSFIIM
jgi:hypothetical protein